MLPDSLAHAKSVVLDALGALLGPRPSAGSPRIHADAQWHVSHPFNVLEGRDAVISSWYEPLRRALPDLEWRPDIFMAGHWDGHITGGAGVWVSTTGHYVGTFSQPLAGIPPTHHLARLRFGEFFRVEGEQIVEARILVDLIDLARQAGIALLPVSPGIEGYSPGPREQDGLMFGHQDPVQTQASMDAVMAMIGGLGAFNRKDLASMGMEAHWDANMMWYGPCGIGAMRGVKGFQTFHQGPFLRAFPDRKGGNHRARLAEGRYVASTGWPSVRATHAGDYLGMPATHQPISMRVMDWWRRGDQGLSENWVFIDLPELFLQMGVDLLDKLPKGD